MASQEKKYVVGSLGHIRTKLLAFGATRNRVVTSVHYYGVHEGNDVEKFVVYPDRSEIHILKESNGTYTLTDHRTISDKAEGLRWLKNRGYTMVNIVSMEYEEYAYRGGIVGLYMIDEFLPSVILDFPPDQHGAIEKEFGLDKQEVISVPYNTYLGVLGRLRTENLF